MKQKIMDEERFDKIWEMAEAERYGQRLAAEYPAWRAKRHRVTGLAVLALIVVGVGLPLWQNSLRATPRHDGYTIAYCNRTDIADQYWVNMADELLMNI